MNTTGVLVRGVYNMQLCSMYIFTFRHGIFISLIIIITPFSHKTFMEYSSEEYKHSIRKVCTTVDGHKYIRSKITAGYFYLKCILFRTHSCRDTGRLNRETDLIIPLNQHNHPVEDSNKRIGTQNQLQKYC